MANRYDSKGRLLRPGEYQRTDGRYEYKFKTEDGKRKSVYSMRLTIRDKGLDVPLRDMEEQINLGLPAKANLKAEENAYSFNSMFELYYEQRPDIRPQSYFVDKENYERYAKKDIGHRDIRELTAGDIRGLYAKIMKTRTLSPATLQNIHIAISKVLRNAVENEILDKNPAQFAGKILPKKSGKQKKALTVFQQEEVMRLAKEVKNTFAADFILFLMHTGCRSGEASALQWSDVDFTSRTVSITKTAYYHESKPLTWHVGPAKSEASNREIPMTDAVYEMLVNLFKHKRKKGPKVDGYDSFVFITKENNPVDGSLANCVLYKIRDKFNEEEKLRAARERRRAELIEKLSCHILRHTFCTRFCETETNLKVIQHIMGHSDIKITMNVYASAMPDENKRAMDKLSDVLGKITGT